MKVFITVDNYTNNSRKETTNEGEKSAEKTRVLIIADSFLGDINEKGLSKDNRVKMKNFTGGTTETILEEVKEPDTLIVHAGTNDLTKGENMLNNVKKIFKSVKRFLLKQN